MTLIDDITHFYSHFLTAELSRLDELYHSTIVFIDPIKTINGITELKDYFEQSRSTVSHCEFHFTDHFHKDTNIFLSWEMDYVHSKLNQGDILKMPGCSQLKTKGTKIIHHRDYYDLGDMLYEHIPIMGPAVKWVKRRV